MMTNIPELKLGLVSVSRDCFPMALSVGRRDALAAAYAKYGMLHNCPVCIESETDVAPALADLKAAGVNALVIFLGNFGPETAETTLAKQFDGPVMFLRSGGGERRQPAGRPRRRLLRYAQCVL